MKVETVGVRDVKLIALVNFLFALLWLQSVFYPLTVFWAEVAIPCLVVLWNGLNLFVWLRHKVPVVKEIPR